MTTGSCLRCFLIITLVIFAAYGCASTPKEIKALGVRAQVDIDKPYKEAALCLVREMDEIMVYGLFRIGIRNDLRIYEQENFADIIGDNREGGTYVVSVRPKGPNSAIVQIFVSDNMIFPVRITEDIKKAADNCNSAKSAQKGARLN